MKKEKKYLFLAVCLVVVVAAAIVLGRFQRTAVNPEQKQTELDIKGARAASYTTAKTPFLNNDDKLFGSEKAALKVFVYEDYSSAYSAALADTLEKIYQENNSQLAVIVRPYVAKNSDLSKKTALAVECAGDQGKWKEMRALIFSQVKNQQFTEEKFSPAASQLNLNEGDFNNCLTNKEKSEKIDKVMAEAQSYSVIGAPTLFVGDEMIPGARPYEDYVDSNGDQIEGLKATVARKLK